MWFGSAANVQNQRPEGHGVKSIRNARSRGQRFKVTSTQMHTGLYVTLVLFVQFPKNDTYSGYFEFLLLLLFEFYCLAVKNVPNGTYRLLLGFSLPRTGSVGPKIVRLSAA